MGRAPHSSFLSFAVDVVDFRPEDGLVHDREEDVVQVDRNELQNALFRSRLDRVRRIVYVCRRVDALRHTARGNGIKDVAERIVLRRCECQMFKRVWHAGRVEDFGDDRRRERRDEILSPIMLSLRCTLDEVRAARNRDSRACRPR